MKKKKISFNAKNKKTKYKFEWDKIIGKNALQVVLEKKLKKQRKETVPFAYVWAEKRTRHERYRLAFSEEKINHLLFTVLL